MSAPTVDVDAVIRKAESQIGVTEVPFGSNRTPYGAWYPMNAVAWCFIWVSWVLHHAGYPFLKMAYTPSGVAWAKANGCWADKSVPPKKGWLPFFDFPGDGVNRVSHVGIVSHDGYDSLGRVRTIEGNTNPAGSRTGGMVMRHNRSLSGIVGYLMVDDKKKAPAKPPVKRGWLEIGPDFKDPDLAFFGGFDNQISEVQIRLAHMAEHGDPVIAAAAGIKLSDMDPGDIDGEFGPNSQRAAKAFKRYVRRFQLIFGVKPPWSEATIKTPNVGPATITMLRWMTTG